MSLQFKQLKQSVIKIELSQEFQESLTGDYVALIHSVLWAHSPVYSLLSSVVYWCSQLWQQSWIQYSTDSLIHSLLPVHFRSYNLPSLCHLHFALLYATHWLAVTQLSTSCCPLTVCIAYCVSRIFCALPFSVGYPLLEASVPFS